MKFNPNNLIILIVNLFFCISIIDKKIKYYFIFLHIELNYGIIPESDFIIIVIIIVYCTNLLKKKVMFTTCYICNSSTCYNNKKKVYANSTKSNTLEIL